MHLRNFFFTVCYLLGLVVTVQAQVTIQGTVRDAKTEETLPSANILIEDSYRGTITNRNGQYSMVVPDSLLPARLVVRFIGYESQTRKVSRATQGPQDFALTPAVSELGEIVVTDENPAVRIMREVIRRKQRWRKQLQTYRAEAYSRQTLSNDTSIVSIFESASELFWDREEGHREILKARRQTANIASGNNFAGVSYMPNFYDDDIDIAGFNVVGVTHPDALSYYDFKLEGQTSLDGQTVYEIQVIPDKSLQPLFQGTIFVLDRDYALLEVDLQPNDVVTFPPPIQSFTNSYRQQFTNFGKDFWLPVDMRIQGDIKVAMMGLNFPEIRYTQVSRITNYRVNVTLPDSLYLEESHITVDRMANDIDTMGGQFHNAIPLSADEQEAYASIDSTATLEDAFKPSGFLARLIDDDDEDDDDQNEGGGESNSDRTNLREQIPGSFSPRLRYNRVDELFAGLRYTVPLTSRLELESHAGYSTGYGEWSYGGELSGQWLNNSTVSSSLTLGYRAETATRFTSPVYTPYFTIIPNLLGNKGYFDFYRREGFRAASEWGFPRDLSVEVGFNSEDHSTLTATTSYDILGRSNDMRANPPVDEGHLRSLDIVMGYNLDEGYNFGITGQRYLRFEAEHSSPALGSDFSYTRYETRLAWNFPTFYQRRLMPNTLDIGIKAGTFSGNLPLQKWGIIDGALGIMSPYGILRARRNHPYEGEQYLAIHAEHNFRTIPFEAIGLQGLADRNLGIILFGGAAKTWGAEDFAPSPAFSDHSYKTYSTNGTHWEAGLSLNGILSLFRLDVAARLDEPALLVNIGVARYF